MSDSAMTDVSPSSMPPSSSSSSSGTFQLTPLYGCESSTGGALCSVLRLDDCTILLDLGWDERYDESQIIALQGIIAEVDAVLITHPDLAHLGALPYAVGKLGLTAPVYCTLPVWRNGQMFMYSSWQERAMYDTLPFTLDDIDKAFDQMRQLKYSETVKLKERGEGIEITPSCAGHMLGGAFWHIKKDVESIIYAVDFNHAAERHLNGALLNAPQLHRPSALITDATNVLVTSVKRSVQDGSLATAITERLRSGGNVLMPVDAAGRVLELLLVIHGIWQQHSLGSTYDLAFLSSQSGNTVDFARSQLEWMTEKCRKMFDSHKTNPFALANVKLLTHTSEIASLRQPFCLLASNACLETSLAQDAFCQLASDPRTLLLLTQRAPTWSLAGQLFDHTTPNALKRPMPREVKFIRRRRVKLEGEELEKFQQEKKMERDQSALEAEKDATDDIDEDEDMDLGVKVDVARKQKAQQLYPLFPFSEPKRSFDIWGELLTPDELRVITGASVSGGGGGSNSNSTNARGHSYSRLLKQEKDIKQQIQHNLQQHQQQLQQQQQQNNANMGDDHAVQEEEPQKTIKEQVTFPLACSVLYLDFEGRSDGRSMKTVIKDVQPRKLIVLTGSQEGKEHLKDHCLTNEICKDVVLPASNQTISVTSESNLYRVNLKDTLLSSLQFLKVNEDTEIAYLEGQIRLNFKEANLPILQQLTATDGQQAKGHPAVLLGEVRPAVLQQIITNEGIQCDLVGGVLVCNGGMVNVHKVNDFQISIQGALCEEYFRIRELLYSQYQIV